MDELPEEPRKLPAIPFPGRPVPVLQLSRPYQPYVLYSRFRLGIGTAGHDPEPGKPIYKNVLGRPQGEANPKAAIEEIKGWA